MKGQEYFLARQPILNERQTLVAYELLFRNSTENHAVIADDMSASMAVIQHAFLTLGVDTALNGKPAFINISEDLLLSDLLEILPADKVVLELLETVPRTEAVINRCMALREAGFRFAIDDVMEDDEALHKILPVVDIVKVDMLGVNMDNLFSIAQRVREQNKILLAEKIDNREQYEALLTAGFTLFQGYYFARPTMIQGRSLSPSAMQLLKLLKLIVSDAEIEQIEDEIKKAPEFMVRMMRLANSSSYFKLEKLKTPRQAILLLGRLQLSRLVQIMMFMREESESWTADPLAQAAIVRGRLIEELLEHSQQHTLKPYGFMLGMFSLSAVLFGVELETIIKILELDDIMKAALLHREGRLGELLTLVEAAEQADGPEGMTAFQTQLETLNICDVSAFNRMQVDALRWAGQM
ncbi:MAG: EAL domain-containing protein [Rhodospirillales bacterium]|nr:EAL domain-containing protein [Rhodospirillales bacterium]